MNKVTRAIEIQKEAFSRHAFFSYIRNAALPLEARLSFLPSMAHFIMSFGDINKYVLPFSSPANELEMAINKHAEEDSAHWPWYLNDLQKLHPNTPMPFTETLHYLWSEERAAARRLSYSLIGLIEGKDAKSRLIIIEVMEATGNVMFSALSEITRSSSLELEFCGALHARHESGHTIGSDDELINQLVFNEPEYQAFRSLIDEGFKAFTRFIDQLYEGFSTATTSE